MGVSFCQVRTFLLCLAGQKSSWWTRGFPRHIERSPKVTVSHLGPGAPSVLLSILACWSSAALTKVAIWLGGCWKNLINDCCGWAKRWLWADRRPAKAGQCSRMWCSSSTALIDLQMRQVLSFLCSWGTWHRPVCTSSW